MTRDTLPPLLRPEDIPFREAKDPAASVFDEALRRHLRGILSQELVDEHRRNPFGPHGPALTAVLAYFRTSPIAGKLAILSLDAIGPYRLVALSGVRGSPPTWAADDVHATLGEAEHAVFLMRLRTLSGQG